MLIMSHKIKSINLLLILIVQTINIGPSAAKTETSNEVYTGLINIRYILHLSNK